MSKSLLYAANTSTQSLSVGDSINFGSTIRSFGGCLSLSGGNVTERCSGYYKHTASFNIAGSVAGMLTINFVKNGVSIPGASIILSIANGDDYSVSVSFVTRERCCVESVISAVVSGIAVDVSMAAIVSEKI